MSNDLISREALKKDIEENSVILEGVQAIEVACAKVLIDIASPVELERPQSNQIAWEQGYEAGLAQGKNERPKGEWEYKNYLWVCNKCQNSFMLQSNFYPNCGADMKGDKE